MQTCGGYQCNRRLAKLGPVAQGRVLKDGQGRLAKWERIGSKNSLSRAIKILLSKKEMELGLPDASHFRSHFVMKLNLLYYNLFYNNIHLSVDGNKVLKTTGSTSSLANGSDFKSGLC